MSRNRTCRRVFRRQNNHQLQAKAAQRQLCRTLRRRRTRVWSFVVVTKPHLIGSEPQCEESSQNESVEETDQTSFAHPNLALAVV